MLMAALRRLGQTVFVLFGISALVFAVFFATPGADPTARIAGKKRITPDHAESAAGIRV